MDKLNDNSYFYAMVLFVIWPFLAAISAFKNYKKSWAKNIFWAFCAFYGFAFAIGAENAGSDIVRYISEIRKLHGEPMTFSAVIGYFLQSGEVDVLDTFISVILSRFTDNQSVITLVYGIVFGFFLSRNMWYVLERLEGKIKPITIFLFVCFFLVIPIWEMNGFRMWTAAHVFIYGLLPYLFEGNKKGILISVSAILVHFSFIIPVGILLGYLLLGNRLVIYFALFVATFFISEINLEAFNNLVENYAPEVIQERSSSYRTEANVEEHRTKAGQGQVWYAQWYGRALKWSVMGFLVLLFFTGRPFFKKNKRYLNLFSFVLLFYGMANLFSSLPSGGRFISIANLGALALIILYIQNRTQEVAMKRFIIAAAPALLLFIVVAVRTGLYSMSATAILGNPIIAMFFVGEHISLNDVMKMVL